MIFPHPALAYSRVFLLRPHKSLKGDTPFHDVEDFLTA